MALENHYCCRCHRTTRFQVREATFTCSCCGVTIEKARPPAQRALIGNPFRSFKTAFAVCNEREP